MVVPSSEASPYCVMETFEAHLQRSSSTTSVGTKTFLPVLSFTSTCRRLFMRSTQFPEV